MKEVSQNHKGEEYLLFLSKNILPNNLLVRLVPTISILPTLPLTMNINIA